MSIHSSWKISQPENQNIAIMLSYPPSYYRQRLQKLGFAGKDKILLDAGCGAGHWGAAASRLNKKVYGIDLTEKYLVYAKKIKKNLKIKNLDLKKGNIEKLPYKAKTFDFIICYSVWMFTDKGKVLKEFFRVLKPGGKVYLGSIIGPVWYPNLILKNLSMGKLKVSLECLSAMLKGIPLFSRKTRKIITEHGFDVVSLSPDAGCGNKKIKVKPIYNAKKWGFWEVYEILAYKCTNKHE